MKNMIPVSEPALAYSNRFGAALMAWVLAREKHAKVV